MDDEKTLKKFDSIKRKYCEELIELGFPEKQLEEDYKSSNITIGHIFERFRVVFFQ